MHNSFETLQKQYRTYRFKQLSKKLIPISLLFIAAAAGTIFYLQSNKQTQIKTPALKKEVPQVYTPLTKVEPEAQKVITAPVTKKVIKDVTYNLHVDEAYIPSNKIVSVQPKQEPKPTSVAITVPKKQHIDNTPPQEVDTTDDAALKPANNLTMSTKVVRSVDESITLYDKEPSYAKALKIAQEYFDLKKYSNASLWAKKANMLNREADGAWILYAKSEYAKGNHKRAVEILRLYVANAASHDADELLLTWTQGE